MAEGGDGKRETHKWTPEQTRALIKFRGDNEARFLKSKSAARPLWETLIKELGLDGIINSQQAAKKWENLKKKYRDLKTPKTGSGTDGGETIAATWQYYSDMHEVLGGQPSTDPPVVVASLSSEDPTTLLMEMVEPTEHRPSSVCSMASATTPATATPSPVTPSPKKRKKKANPIMDFLLQESNNEQKRHEGSEKKTDRFLELFEKLVDKI